MDHGGQAKRPANRRGKSRGKGAGLSVQELKAMTAARMHDPAEDLRPLAQLSRPGQHMHSQQQDINSYATAMPGGVVQQHSTIGPAQGGMMMGGGGGKVSLGAAGGLVGISSALEASMYVGGGGGGVAGLSGRVGAGVGPHLGGPGIGATLHQQMQHQLQQQQHLQLQHACFIPIDELGLHHTV